MSMLACAAASQVISAATPHSKVRRAHLHEVSQLEQYLPTLAAIHARPWSLVKRLQRQKMSALQEPHKDHSCVPSHQSATNFPIPKRVSMAAADISSVKA